MRYRSGLGWFGGLSWALALVACGAASSSPQDPAASPDPGAAGPPPVVIAPPPPGSADPGNPGAGASTPPSPSTPPPRECKLPAPKKSGDPCQTDADCGPSVPCHAPACVSKAKSPPRPLNMMCTQSYGCDTADANRCGCFEGSCALIPPT